MRPTLNGRFHGIGHRTYTLLMFIVLTGCGPRPAVKSHSGCDGRQEADGLPSCVRTTQGVKSIEEEYIPGVIECELGPLTTSEAALDAQAIAARTYLLKHLQRKGPDAEIPTTPRFQCWKPPHRQRAFASAQRTVGLVMQYEDEVINGNYVSGARTRTADCTPDSPKANGYDFSEWAVMRELYVRARAARRRHPFKGTSWTEVIVTYNEALRGDDVTPSPIASIRPANRGALSQWGAICLGEKQHYAMEQILAYFYGDDIKLAQRAPSRPADVPAPKSAPPVDDTPEGVLIETTRPIDGDASRPAELPPEPEEPTTDRGADPSTP